MECPLGKKKEREKAKKKKERRRRKQEEEDKQKEEEEEEVIFYLDSFFQVWNHPKARENRKSHFQHLRYNGSVVPDSTADLKICIPWLPTCCRCSEHDGWPDRCLSQGNAPCLIVDLALAWIFFSFFLEVGEMSQSICPFLLNPDPPHLLCFQETEALYLRFVGCLRLNGEKNYFR